MPARAHGSADQDVHRSGVAVEAHLRARLAEGRKLLVPYITGGITPDWLSYLRRYIEAGADAIEIGLPFSDPILDGPVIQDASYRSLGRGTTIPGLLQELELLRELDGADLPVPLIAMTYYNLVVHAGAEQFCAALARAGVRGLIVPDAPVDEVDELAAAAARAGVELSLLAAPSSAPERLASIAGRSRGFVYAVTVMGTTGVRGGLADTGIELAGRLKGLTERPVLLGFGIASPEQAVHGATVADGVVVASGLMRMVLDGAPPADVAAQVARLRQALDATFS